MPVIGNTGNGTNNGPTQCQELYKEDAKVDITSAESPLKVPASEDRLKDTHRCMARGKRPPTLAHVEAANVCVCAGELVDEFSGKKCFWWYFHYHLISFILSPWSATVHLIRFAGIQKCWSKASISILKGNIFSSVENFDLFLTLATQEIAKQTNWPIKYSL